MTTYHIVDMECCRVWPIVLYTFDERTGKTHQYPIGHCRLCGEMPRPIPESDDD